MIDSKKCRSLDVALDVVFGIIIVMQLMTRTRRQFQKDFLISHNYFANKILDIGLVKTVNIVDNMFTMY